MQSVLDKFDEVCRLMHGALMHKDQEVALAASEFWSGVVNTKLDENDEIRVSKINDSMEFILPALLESSMMQNADRMGDMPTKENDISHVESKNLENDEEDEEDE